MVFPQGTVYLLFPPLKWGHHFLVEESCYKDVIPHGRQRKIKNKKIHTIQLDFLRRERIYFMQRVYLTNNLK